MSTMDELQNRIERLERYKRVLTNRCWVYTGGCVCPICEILGECEHGTLGAEEPKRKVRDRSNIFKGR